MDPLCPQDQGSWSEGATQLCPASSSLLEKSFPLCLSLSVFLARAEPCVADGLTLSLFLVCQGAAPYNTSISKVLVITNTSKHKKQGFFCSDFKDDKARGSLPPRRAKLGIIAAWPQTGLKESVD